MITLSDGPEIVYVWACSVGVGRGGKWRGQVGGMKLWVEDGGAGRVLITVKHTHQSGHGSDRLQHQHPRSDPRPDLRPRQCFVLHHTAEVALAGEGAARHQLWPRPWSSTFRIQVTRSTAPCDEFPIRLPLHCHPSPPLPWRRLDTVYKDTAAGDMVLLLVRMPWIAIRLHSLLALNAAYLTYAYVPLTIYYSPPTAYCFLCVYNLLLNTHCLPRY